MFPFLRETALVCFVLSALPFGDFHHDSLEVRTKSGKVRGITKTTFDGTEVRAFLGIPYGAPATGSNRFGPPKPVQPWSETLNATSHPRPCYQVVDPILRTTEYISHLQETEDCLTLNIWAPKHRTNNAVLFWIFGGGFAFGSVDLPLYDGSILAARENVIVVSANYRLSAFGLLYLDHPLAPGNAGLLDQALAMQWVKNNIQAFGGDPRRVTIFGESAGAGSVGLHLLAPSSTNLFENALMQSGTGADFWSAVKPEEALAVSSKFAEMAGCPIQEGKVEQAVKCLQEINADRLHSILMDFENDTIKLSFRPVVDGNFLPSDPTELLTDGKFDTKKNVLVGYNKEDGAGHLTLAKGLEFKEDSLYSEEQIRGAIQTLIKIKQNLTDFQTDLVKYVYTDWKNPEDRFSARSLLVQCITDRWFACGSVKTANKMADRGNRVFMYRFDQIPTKDAVHPLPRWMGSAHANELRFVFGQVTRNKEKELAPEVKLSKQMMRYWANFAKAGDPRDEFLAAWPKYDSYERLMLKLDGRGLAVEKNDRTGECDFWENIFPKTELPYTKNST